MLWASATELLVNQIQDYKTAKSPRFWLLRAPGLTSKSPRYSGIVQCLCCRRWIEDCKTSPGYVARCLCRCQTSLWIPGFRMQRTPNYSSLKFYCEIYFHFIIIIPLYETKAQVSLETDEVQCQGVSLLQIEELEILLMLKLL